MTQQKSRHILHYPLLLYVFIYFIIKSTLINFYTNFKKSETIYEK